MLGPPEAKTGPDGIYAVQFVVRSTEGAVQLEVITAQVGIEQLAVDIKIIGSLLVDLAQTCMRREVVGSRVVAGVNACNPPSVFPAEMAAPHQPFIMHPVVQIPAQQKACPYIVLTAITSGTAAPAGEVASAIFYKGHNGVRITIRKGTLDKAQFSVKPIGTTVEVVLYRKL